jgi:hypothetical protein
LEGDEAGLGAEQAGVDQGPLGLPGPVVQVDGLDGTDAGAVPVHHGAGFPATNGVEVGHGMTRIRAARGLVDPIDTLARSRPFVSTVELGRSAPGRLAASAGLPAVLAVKARLTAASGRLPIDPAQACDAFLTAERLGPERGACSRLRP